MKRSRGSVLVQVLVTSVIVSIFAAGMMELLMMRSQAIQRDQERAAMQARAESGLNAIVAGWVANQGQNCTTVSGFTLSGGTSGGCNCTYTSTDGNSTTICAGSGCNPSESISPCKVRIVGQKP